MVKIVVTAVMVAGSRCVGGDGCGSRIFFF